MSGTFLLKLWPLFTQAECSPQNEEREETANHSLGTTGMVSSQDSRGHASASRDHQRYLRGAGVEIWPPGRWRRESKAKAAIEVITGSDAAKPAMPGSGGPGNPNLNLNPENLSRKGEAKTTSKTSHSGLKSSVTARGRPASDSNKLLGGFGHYSHPGLPVNESIGGGRSRTPTACPEKTAPPPTPGQDFVLAGSAMNWKPCGSP
jgi:hypothetical protein